MQKALYYFRFMKMDEARHKRELEFRLKQTQLENERMQQGMEHEMKMFKMLMENKPTTSNNHGSVQGMVPLSMATSSPIIQFPHVQQMPWDQTTSLYSSTSMSNSFSADNNSMYTPL